jgi:hypothetical protein
MADTPYNLIYVFMVLWWPYSLIISVGVSFWLGGLTHAVLQFNEVTRLRTIEKEKEQWQKPRYLPF